MRRMSQEAPGRVIPDWSLADKLRKIRRDVVGVDQAEMAARLGWPKGAYQSWEAGKARPRELVALAKRIELLTGVPATWVLGLDDAAATPSATGTAESITTGDLATGSAVRGINRH